MRNAVIEKNKKPVVNNGVETSNIHIKYEFKNQERYQDKVVIQIHRNANDKGYDSFFGYKKSDKSKNIVYLGCQKDMDKKEKYEDKATTLTIKNVNAKGYDAFYRYDRSSESKKLVYLGCRKDPDFDPADKGLIGSFGALIRLNENEKIKHMRRCKEWALKEKETAEEITFVAPPLAEEAKPEIKIINPVAVMKVA